MSTQISHDRHARIHSTDSPPAKDDTRSAMTYLSLGTGLLAALLVTMGLALGNRQGEVAALLGLTFEQVDTFLIPSLVWSFVPALLSVAAAAVAFFRGESRPGLLIAALLVCLVPLAFYLLMVGPIIWQAITYPFWAP